MCDASRTARESIEKALFVSVSGASLGVIVLVAVAVARGLKRAQLIGWAAGMRPRKQQRHTEYMSW